MSEWLKQVIDHCLAEKAKVPKRHNRTLYLKTETYEKFQAWCKSEGHPTSKIIDHLIEIFLKELEETKT